MKRIFCIILLICFSSCQESIDVSDKVLGSQDSLINTVALNSIQGSYLGCSASLAYPGFFTKVSVSITGVSVEINESIHATAACTSNFSEERDRYKIKKLEFDINDPTDLEVDYEVESIEFVPYDPFYITQNYCGIAGMSLGQYYNITGLSCPTYLAASAHHTSIKSLGEIHYSRIKISASNRIQIIRGFSESGNSENEREFTDRFEITRQ